MARTREENRVYHAEYRKNNRESVRRNARKYSQKNKEQNRESHLRRKFGISGEQFQQMSVAQEGMCAICGVKPEKLCVDHNHTTNVVRALLCKKCNFAIGLLNEDSATFAKAIVYLEKYNGC